MLDYLLVIWHIPLYVGNGLVWAYIHVTALPYPSWDQIFGAAFLGLFPGIPVAYVRHKVTSRRYRIRSRKKQTDPQGSGLASAVVELFH